MRRSVVLTMLVAFMFMTVPVVGCSTEASTLDSDKMSPDTPMTADENLTALPASSTPSTENTQTN